MKTNDNKQASPRLLALKIIEKTLGGAKIQEALNYYLEKSTLNTQDRQLCTDLVYGYFRTRIRLDFILAQFLKKPAKLPPSMRILLALGLYGLLFQDKVPPYASINETVKAIRKICGQALANVANGVLRNIQKLGEELHEMDWYRLKAGDDAKGEAFFYAMPEEAAKLWRASYGEEAASRLMERSSRRPWHGLRINARHAEAARLRAGLGALEGAERIGEYGFAFPPGKYPESVAGQKLTDWIRQGALSMQAPASMLIVEELGLTDLDGAVWDCCAGSGIKSAQLLERGANVQLASDISRQRLENIRPFCERLHLEAPNIVQASASRPPLAKWKGHILADAPCSGLGVLARRPDIRENIKEEKFWESYAATQEEILDALASLLEEGKKLVYITCTLNPHENEFLVRKILSRHPELTPAKEWQSPDDHPWLEGMYGAVLLKKPD